VPLKESEVSKRWAGARLTDSHRNPTERFSTQEVNNFMRISEIIGVINTYGDMRKYIYVDMITGELKYNFETERRYRRKAFTSRNNDLW